MVIYCDLQGNVTSVPSSVPKGTILSNIVVIAPKMVATAVLNVKPPTQENFEPLVCKVSLGSDNQIVYNAKLSKSVTSRSGRCDYQLEFVDAAGQALASYAGSFNVSRGVDVELPGSVDEFSDYSLEALYHALTSITTAYDHITGLREVIGWDSEAESFSELSTTQKTIISAINQLHNNFKSIEALIGEGDIEDVPPPDAYANESGLIAVANAAYRIIKNHMGKIIDEEDLELAEDPHHAQAAMKQRIDNHNISPFAHPDLKATLSDHASRIEENRAVLNEVKGEIGSDRLSTTSQKIKGAINETIDLARKNKEQSELNRTNLVNVTAQLQGISRTYSISGFEAFLEFMNGRSSVQLSEDRDGDGVKETHYIFVTDLKTGDNILLVEHNVPDFWFSSDTNAEAETYEYEGVVYPLVAKDASGSVVGLFHKSETDYNVIANHATSAAISADEAKEAASESLQYRDEIKELADDIHTHQIAPPLSLLDEAIILTAPTLAQLP